MENFYTLSDYHNCMLSNDGNVIFLSLKRYDSFGDGNDLYVSFNNRDGNWSEPQNLGQIINTSRRIKSFLASDGISLYFSSNGHGGYGGMDLFVSKRLDNTYTSWSIPENLGPTINSSGDENFFSIPASGDFIYFSSTNDSYGEQDLFRIGLPMDKRSNPVVLVSGKVLNAKTNEPMDAEVYYEDLNTGEELGKAKTNSSTGIYKIILPGGKKYGFRAEAPGFISVNDNLDLRDLKFYQKEIDDLVLVPIEEGQNSILIIYSLTLVNQI